MKLMLSLVQKMTVILLLLAGSIAAAQSTKNAPSKSISSTYDIRSFGAIGDGKIICTKSIQQAIDACSQKGGGVVLVASGTYVTGTIYFKSNVILRLEAGAILLGSPHITDYTTDTDRTMYRGEPYMDRCLIFARDVQNIGIEGSGTIDGQGKSFPEPGDTKKNRPKMIRLMNCSHIRLHDVTLKSPASWTTEWRSCTDIAVDGVTIFSRANSNGDGLDFDGCKNVRVSNSTFDTSDDSICLQTSSLENPCQDITIMNCNFSSRWAGIRIGLLSRANFENVAVTNCTFRDHKDSGLKIQMMEGAEMKNMIFSNLVMKNVPRPVFLTFNSQNAWVDASEEQQPVMKRVYNIQFNNILVETETGGNTCAFIATGMPGHPIEGVTFNNIRAIFPGGGTADDAQCLLEEFTVENLKGRWPEYSGLRGTVPAYGFYLRHMNNVSIKNVEINTLTPDARPAVVFVDVNNFKIEDAPQPDKR